MKILITGGAGFIGSRLAQTYLDQGHSVVIVDDLSYGDLKRVPPGAKVYIQDICNRAKLKSIFWAECPEVVSHQAALVSVRDSVREPQRFFQVNVEGTRTVLDLAEEAAARKLIFASSGGAVYGEAASLPVNETAECRPLSPYGENKRQAEEILREANGRLEKVILRYGNVYGPGQDPLNNNSVISIFAHQLIGGQHPVVFGDGSQIRDYVFVEDVVRANLLALQAGVQGVFNIGTGVGHSLEEVFQQIARRLDLEHTPTHRPAYPFEVLRNVLDIRLARETLGWQPAVSLEAGIDITVRSILENHGARLATQPLGLQAAGGEG